MEWTLLFLLVTGEVAEKDTTRAECNAALNMAARESSVTANLTDGRSVRTKPWGVVCVARAVHK